MGSFMHRGNKREGENDLPILESLYELWINEDPACDEHVWQLFRKLREWTGEMSIEEADRMNGIIVDLCIAYSRKGFLDGIRLGGLLIHEILRR